jgi:4-amino-4-deoxy-L-arabinose transferase-like glycosyltransferase
MREKLVRLLQAPWFIALIALLLRIAYLLSQIAEIPRDVLAAVPFQNEVGNVASAVAAGHGFCCLFRQPTGPTAWLPPVYPLLIASLFKIFGTFTFRSFVASVLLNILASAVVCLPLVHATRRIAGRSAAALAGWLWTFSPIAILLPFAWIWDSALSAFLAAALLWATLRLDDWSHDPADSPSGSAAVPFALYGLLWGVSLLTNPALGALLPFLLAWVLVRFNTSNKQKLRALAISTAMILTTCAPWTIRNYIQFHRLIPLRSNFPYEFWSGNNTIFDPNSREVNRITRYEQIHLYAQLGETTFLNEKWQGAKAFIRAHPWLYVQLSARRIVATWFGTDSPVHDFVHADSQLARYVLAWNAISFFAMLAGLVRLYVRRREYFVPIATFPLIFPITFYLAHTSLRHRHPCDPAIALLMAIAFLPPPSRQ